MCVRSHSMFLQNWFSYFWGPIHTNAFSKVSVFIEAKTKQIFASTLAFWYRFHLSTLKRSKTIKPTGNWDCACVSHTPSWIDTPIWTGIYSMACDAFYVNVFKSPLSTLETVRFKKRCVFKCLHFWNPFRKSPILSAFSGVLVWMIGESLSKSMRFLRKRLSVDGAWLASVFSDQLTHRSSHTWMSAIVQQWIQ